MLKKWMKKTGRKSKKINPCSQTFITVTAIVIAAALLCNAASADKDMNESNEDKGKAQSAPKFMEETAGLTCFKNSFSYFQI
jgi:hypothetical protein